MQLNIFTTYSRECFLNCSEIFDSDLIIHETENSYVDLGNPGSRDQVKALDEHILLGR